VQQFYLTPRGMVGSLRRKSNGDVTIGRQTITETVHLLIKLAGGEA